MLAMNDAIEQRAQRAELATVVLVAVATLLLLQATRVFVGYLVFVVDQSNRLELGMISGGVFAAPLLAAAGQRLFGVRRTLLAATALLAMSRLAVQFSEQPVVRLSLAALAIAAWSWIFLSVFASRRQQLAPALLLGMLLDITIRSATITVDLPWMPETLDDLLTLVSIAALVISLLRAAPPETPPDASGAVVQLVFIGPCLVLYHLLFLNHGFAQLQFDTSFPIATLILVGLFILTGPFVVTSHLHTAVMPFAPRGFSGARAIILRVALLLILSGIFANMGSGWNAVTQALVLAALVNPVLGLAVAGDARFLQQRPEHPALWFTIGFIAQAALLFMYYSATGSTAVIVVAGAILMVAPLIAEPRSIPLRQVKDSMQRWGVVALVALIVAVGQWWTWSEPETGAPLQDTLTVMSWNLQSGFARDNRWDLKAQARAIAAERPDVVVLQEVSRGWLVSSYTDELLWLSRELDMPYVWGPASADQLWGNAVLSRAPLHDVDVLHYSSTQNLKRSALRVGVATETGTVWVIATHLDNPSGAGAVRFAQVNELVEFRGQRNPAIVAGDFNAVPDSDVMAALLQSGLVDSGAGFPSDAGTSDDGRRIDYILATPDLTLLDASIVETSASDHHAVIAVYALP